MFQRTIFPLLIIAALCGFAEAVAADARPLVSSDGFARLPVQEGGRRKPLDSYAWESVRSIHGRSHFRDGEGLRWRAVDLLLNLASDPQRWQSEKLVRIDYHELKTQLDLPVAEKYFSFDEIVAQPELTTLIREAGELNRDAARATKLSSETEALAGRLYLLRELLDGTGFRIFPDPADPRGAWRHPQEAGDSSSEAWRRLLAAWRTEDPTAFGAALVDLKQGVSAEVEGYPRAGELAMELSYNRLQPFHKAWLCYLFLALLSLAAAVWPVRWLGWAGAGLLLLAFLYHSAGLTYITLITGRAPVSNLFESLVFIVWTMILLAGVFYLSSGRENYLLIIAGVLGTLSMGYALDSTVDISINPLVPVLRSYWLNLHVTVITFSYGAFAVAAGLGHAYLLRYWLKPAESAALSRIDRISYRALQVGVLTLTAGIILGAVWANESWGRYWGWDPKETWSLITLLFYIALIHGRLNGWINKAGSAIMNISGLAVVLMTYFGVNYYLSGLHSYATGNPDPFPLKLIVYLACEAVFILLCYFGGRQRLNALRAEAAR